MEKLIKSALGQWTLVKAWLPRGKEHEAGMLNEHGELKPHPYSTAVGQQGSSGINASHSSSLTGLFKQLNDAHTAGSKRAAEHYLGEIKKLTTGAAPGSIDLGHLDQLRTNHKEYVRGLTRLPQDWLPEFSKEDYMDAADRHIGGAKSLKEIHDKQGIGAVRGLARAHGVYIDSYGNNPFFDRNNLKNIAGDVQAFVTGDYGNHVSKPRDTIKHPDGGEEFYYDHKPNQSRPPNEQAHQDKINAVWGDFIGEPDGEKQQKKMVNAVLDRGENAFRHAHGIKG